MSNKAVKFDIKAQDEYSLAFNKVKKEMNNFSRVIDQVKNKNTQLKNSNNQLDGSYKKVSNSASKYKAILTGIVSSVIIKDFVDTALAIERTDRTFKAIFKNSKRVKEEMNFVRDSAKSLGLDLGILSTEYAKLSAASNGTALEGDKTRKIFLAISKASVTLGMSADETSGAFRAIQQMISKGKVQAEELRGQLGERLPGAFQIAARSLGLTTAELDKFLSTGKVTAEDLLPALADELDKTFGTEAESAIDSIQAKINNLKTELYELKKELVKAGLIEVFKDLANYSASFAKNTIYGIKEIKKFFSSGKKTQDQKPTVNTNTVDHIESEIKRLNKKRDMLKKFISQTSKSYTVSARRNVAALNVDIGLLEARLAKIPMMLSKKGANEFLKKQSQGPLVNVPFSPSLDGFEDQTPSKPKTDLSKSSFKEKMQRLAREKQALKDQEKAKKKALALDKKLHSQANNIVSSYDTQVERLEKQKQKIEELYKLRDSKGNPFITEDDFKKTMDKIDSEMDKATNSWKSNIKSFADISKEAFAEIKDGIGDMLKEGEFSLGKLGDLLKQTFLNKAIDLTVNAGMDSLFGGFFAGGGDLQSGKFGIVGEKGPEIIAPSSSSRHIVSNRDSRSLLSGSSRSQGNVINQNIHLTPNVEQTIAAQMQRYLPMLSEHAVAALRNAELRGVA